MVSSQISSGVAEARGASQLLLLMQYLQSNAQSLLIRIFKSDMQRPSGVKEWQHPSGMPFPIPPAFLRPLPEEEHETSYFALCVRMCSFSSEIIYTV